jgi:hypothetical protein
LWPALDRYKLVDLLEMAEFAVAEGAIGNVEVSSIINHPAAVRSPGHS